VITAISGQVVNNLNDFQAVLDQVAAGQKAQFTVLRGADAVTATATLVARQAPPVNRGAEDPGPPPGAADPLAPAGAPAVAPNAAAARASLGISVVQLTEQARAAYGVATTRGALVASVKAGGPAERAGIPVGAVIVAIDGKRVNTPDEVVDTVAASLPGDELELSYYRGVTLTRKTVRLAPAALDARAAPAPAAAPILGGVAGDRPIVRRVGEVIDNLARPAGGAPVGMIDEVNALKSQVELLQATVRSLEDRLNRLEGKVAPRANEEGAAAVQPAAPADPVRKLELKLAPPDKPALPTPPPVP
jgi:serine protease Do